MEQFYGGCGVAGGGISVCGALDRRTSEPLVMFICKMPQGGSFVLYLSWEQMTAVRVGLHSAMEGMLSAPAEYQVNQRGFLGFAPYDEMGELAFVARHRDGQIITVMLDTLGVWVLLRALAGFIKQNSALLAQRRTDGVVRTCVRCGTLIPPTQAVLVRLAPIDVHLTLTPLSLSDPNVMACCTPACADAVINEFLILQVVERAGPRPSCLVCGDAATWLDPINQWMCETCGETVEGGSV